jgi:hypothetical protein
MGRDYVMKHSQNMKITVFRNMMLCDLVNCYQLSVYSRQFAEEPVTSIFKVEKWGVKLVVAGSFEMLVTKLPDYKASHPIRLNLDSY